MVAVGLVVVAADGATMIGVNARAEDAFSSLDPTDVAGAPLYRQSNWNNVDKGGGDGTTLLVDDAGDPTSVTVSYGGDFYGGTTLTDTSTPDGKLMKGYQRWNSHSRVWITFAGLTPGDEYHVVLYHVYKDGSEPTMEVGIQDAAGEAWHEADWKLYSVVGYDDASDDYEGTYTVFEGAVVDSAGRLRVGTGEIDSGSRPGFNAVQIVQFPEPATLGFLALGALGVLVGRKGWSPPPLRWPAASPPSA